MSYILEALKKSEQERGDSGSPTVQTVHTSSLQYQRRERAYWPWVLATVVIINLAVLGYLLTTDRTTTLVQTPAPALPVTAQAVAAPTQRQAVAAPTAPATAPVQPPAETPTPSTATVSNDPPLISTHTAVVAPATPPPPVNKSMPSGDARLVRDIYDLPVDQQAAVPDLTFSAHVYSSNPSQRSVVINGDFMEEGDMLTTRVRIDEITRDGVIFEVDGSYFRSSVVSGWRVN